MEIWHHIAEVWEYLIDHVVVLTGNLFGFDPKHILPWAQLTAAILASIVSCWGIANIWNHFDSRRRALLANFLTKEEKRILERKHELAERFLRPRKTTEGAEPLDIHASLDAAIEFYDKPLDLEPNLVVLANRALANLITKQTFS